MATKAEESKAPETLQAIQALEANLQAMAQFIQGSQTVGIEKVRDPNTGKMVGGRIKMADGTTRDVQIQ